MKQNHFKVNKDYHSCRDGGVHTKGFSPRLLKWVIVTAFLLSLPQRSLCAKNQEIENLISEYLDEKVKEDGDKEDGVVNNHTPLNFEQEKVRQFRIVEYLFTQPEMDKLTILTPQEQQCFELKRFAASVPFNNNLLDTSGIFSRTRDQFHGISFRSLVYKLILDEAFVTTTMYSTIKPDVNAIVNLKQEFFRVATKAEIAKMPIVYGSWKNILEKGEEEIERLTKSKYYNIKQFSDTQNKIIEMTQEIQNISDNLLSRSSQGAKFVEFYREGEDFVEAVAVATEAEMINGMKFVTTSFNSDADLVNNTVLLIGLLNHLKVIERVGKWMGAEKYSHDKSTKTLMKDVIKEIEKVMDRISKTRKTLIKAAHRIMKLNKEVVMKLPDYKKMLNLMNEYKIQLKILYGFYEKIVDVNRELDKLSYIMFNQEEEQRKFLLDVYIGPETSVIVQNKLERLVEKNTDRSEFMKDFEALERIDKNNDFYGKVKNWGGWRNDESDEINRLTRLKSVIDQITSQEERIDFYLANAMSESRRLTMTGANDSNNQKCLDDLTMGHLMINMAKHYIIVDLDLFMKTYMLSWHILDVRSFVLLNYAMFTSEDYQGRMIDDYPIQKIPPGQQDNKKGLIIRDYTLRLNFFVGMFRQREVEMDSLKRTGFLSRQGLFFRNLIFNICNYFRNVRGEQIVAFMVEVVSIILAKLIPFSSLFKGIFVILRSIISLLLGQLIRFVVRKYQEYKLQIYAFWIKATRMIRDKLGAREIHLLDCSTFFQRNGSFMNYATQCWKYDNCFEGSVHDETREEIPQKKVLDLSSLKSVDEKYRTVLQLTKKSQRKKSDFNYIRKITMFKGGNYVLKKDQLKNNQDLLITTLLYYRSEMAFDRGIISEERMSQLYI